MTLRSYSDGQVVTDRPAVTCARYKYETFQDAAQAAKERSKGALDGFDEVPYLCPRCDWFHVDVRTARKALRKRVKSLRQRRKAARKARG